MVPCQLLISAQRCAAYERFFSNLQSFPSICLSFRKSSCSPLQRPLGIMILSPYLPNTSSLLRTSRSRYRLRWVGFVGVNLKYESHR